RPRGGSGSPAPRGRRRWPARAGAGRSPWGSRGLLRSGKRSDHSVCPQPYGVITPFHKPQESLEVGADRFGAPMTGQTKGPVAGRRADAVRNRARVLAAAEEVFDRLGGTASTAEIARVAGVGIGTVFRHFPTKQDLLAAIVKERLDRLWVEAEDLVAGDDPEAFFVF